MRASRDAVPQDPYAARHAFARRPWAMAVATVGGVGLLPGGPGTYAAALAVWPAWYIATLAPTARLGCLVALFLVAWVASERAGQALGESDSRRIVIDEVLGLWVTLAPFAPLTPAMAFAGFLAFRVFDILKPPPARWIDRHLHTGLGVNLDDVVAGLWAAMLLGALRAAGLLA